MTNPNAEVQLVLEAEVDTPGPPVPLPGHSHMISITRYRVLRVMRGAYTHPMALVGHNGAHMNPPEFRRGVRKILDLSLGFPPHSTQLNPFTRENPGIPVFYCVAARVIGDAGEA